MQNMQTTEAQDELTPSCTYKRWTLRLHQVLHLLPHNVLQASTYLFYAIVIILVFTVLDMWPSQAWTQTAVLFAASASVPLLLLGSLLHRNSGVISNENIVHHLLPTLAATWCYTTYYNHGGSAIVVAAVVVGLSATYVLVVNWLRSGSHHAKHRGGRAHPRPKEVQVYTTNPFDELEPLVASGTTLGLVATWLLR